MCYINKYNYLYYPPPLNKCQEILKNLKKFKKNSLIIIIILQLTINL